MRGKYYNEEQGVLARGTRDDANRNRNNDYLYIGDIMKTILVNKLEAGSEPSLIMRRFRIATAWQVLQKSSNIIQKSVGKDYEK